jgi:hypothetical protein
MLSYARSGMNLAPDLPAAGPRQSRRRAFGLSKFCLLAAILFELAACSSLPIRVEQAQLLDTCETAAVQHYFQTNSTTIIASSRSPVVKYLTQFREFKVAFRFDSPILWDGVKMKWHTMPIDISIDTTSNGTLSGCVSQHKITAYPIYKATSCIKDGIFKLISEQTKIFGYLQS